MAWPPASSYASMLQIPRAAFRDPPLRQCRIRRDASNQPFGIAGQFAVVYQAELPDGSMKAVRVFTSDRQERTERYEAISEHLQTLQLDCLVPFCYQSDGIRADDGKFYPLVTMDWVEGLTLFDWVRDRCRAADCRALRQTADQWRGLVRELAVAGIAHGDLQHANVMVDRNNVLKLVDYDGMCVPRLVGKPNLELGLEPYQHPGRNPGTCLSPQLDNFSALLIYVVLRALAVRPDLWSDHVDTRQYDKLLLRREDLRSPDDSELIIQLRCCGDAQAARLTDRLTEVYRDDFERVPSLENVLTCDELSQLLDAERWEDAWVMYEAQPAGFWTPLPDHLQQGLDLARARLAPPAAVQPAATTSGSPPAPWLVPQPTPLTTAAVSLPTAGPPPIPASAAKASETALTLLAALRAGNRAAFVTDFDAGVCREHVALFQPVQADLVAWTREEILAPDRLSLRPARDRDSLSPVADSPSVQRALWTWPPRRFTQRCVVGIGAKRPPPGVEPQLAGMRRRLTVDRETFEQSGGCPLHVSSELNGMLVFVWAIVDLGFRQLFSAPIELGRLRAASPAGRRRSGWWS